MAIRIIKDDRDELAKAFRDVKAGRISVDRFNQIIRDADPVGKRLAREGEVARRKMERALKEIKRALAEGAVAGR